ncbi:MAG: MBL fold metallo-hydrolase [Firmicutes bacterium HGW-Firmicutes-12]|jgi:7,8-dihydropterin-6-yl-methyl-4-(beta-D-ribofuranosyl)aminobenzene 5'-phosphate synthase|nr:MAG: MBL fold metallo-hydrolase [Firmicutes bacterium HGW-Firmicutes-12]
MSNRRDFIKGMAAGTVAGFFATKGVTSSLFRSALVPAKNRQETDIGELKGITVKCISETSWFDNNTQMADFKKAGGSLVTQYDVEFSRSGVPNSYDGTNAGGYSTLIEFEFLDGSRKKILLDTGWNVDWMTHRFKEEGVDKMLENGEIEYLVVSHDHYDHFWGIEAVLQYNPDIKIMIPDSFMENSYKLLAGGSFPKPPISNSVPHTGQLVKHDLKKVYPLFPGVAAVTFDCPCGRGVRGEQVLVCNIKDKGITTISGCCHMGIITLMEYTKANFKGGDKIYGVYGGLHVSPYDNWNPQNDDLVLSINNYNVQKLGCNHCTGYITAEKMIAAGVPVVKGSGKNLTKRDIYLGNGDVLVF